MHVATKCNTSTKNLAVISSITPPVICLILVVYQAPIAKTTNGLTLSQVAKLLSYIDRVRGSAITMLDQARTSCCRSHQLPRLDNFVSWNYVWECGSRSVIIRLRITPSSSCAVRFAGQQRVAFRVSWSRASPVVRTRTTRTRTGAESKDEKSETPETAAELQVRFGLQNFMNSSSRSS